MSSTSNRIAVIGDGGWGTTIALVLSRLSHSVTLWGAFEDYIAEMSESRENTKFLPGFKIPHSVRLTSDIDQLAGAVIVFVAVPSKYLRPVMQRLSGHPALKGVKGFVVLSKGIEMDSLKLMSEVIRDEFSNVTTAVLSGPCISREIAGEIPTAVTLASADEGFRHEVRDMLQSEFLNVLETDDETGVQIGGSLKNVLAIAAGICDGLGLGTNLKSVLVTRGLAEIARLGKVMGADRETFMGLSGMGDLITTSFSSNSRNHNCGVALAEGKKLKDIISSSEMVIEGIDAAVAAAKLAKKHSVYMPIAEAVNNILFKEEKPDSIVKAIFCSEHRIESH